MTGVCIREKRGRLGYKDTSREEGHAMLEAEIGVMLPQAKEHPGPPEAGRGKEASLLGPSEGVWYCRYF